MEDDDNLPFAEDRGASAMPNANDDGDEGLDQEAIVAEPVAETVAAPVEKDRAQEGILAELREERKARQRLEQTLTGYFEAQSRQAAPQEPKPAPSIYDDEAATITHYANPLIEPIRQSQAFNNKLIAEARYGEDAVTAAEQSYNEAQRSGQIDVDTQRRILSSPNPYAAALQWHRQQAVLQQTGGDLTAYEQKLMNDPEFAKRFEAHRRKAGAAPEKPLIQLPQTSRASPPGQTAAPLSSTDFLAALRG